MSSWSWYLTLLIISALFMIIDVNYFALAALSKREMNIFYLNLFQLCFVSLFFNDKLVAGQFFVNETQEIGFS